MSAVYQIFVVEDELLIRQSIRNTIQQMQGPYSFCGEASDGEMALSMMQELMPDILLTDLRMPFLDGFGLIRLIRERMPWLKIIIISGYGDFEYAQRAITLGVDQYLLKPVRPAELMRVIGEVAAQIERDKKQTLLPDGFDQDEVRSALQQRFLRQLLYGGADTGTLITQAGTLGIDLVHGHYLTAVGYLDAENADPAQLERIAQRALSGAENTLLLFAAPDQITLFSCDNDSEALDERIYQQIRILRHQLREVCPVSTWVISAETQRLGAVSDVCRAAAGLLKQVSAVSAGQVINVGDGPQITAELVAYQGVFGEDFLQKLQYASAREAPALLARALDEEEGGRFDSMLTRYNALIELMKLSVQMIARGTPDADEKEIAAQLGAEVDILRAAGKRDTFREAAEELLRHAMRLRGESRNDLKHNPVITRAEAYVRANFCDPNIRC